MRAAILAAIQPVQTEGTKTALQNAARKRKRVQRKHGEVLTFEESLIRLEAEEKERALKKQKKAEKKDKTKKSKGKSKKSLQMFDEEICFVCKEEEPPCDSDDESDIDWVKCEKCGQWYHVECIDNYENPCLFC